MKHFPFAITTALLFAFLYPVVSLSQGNTLSNPIVINFSTSSYTFNDSRSNAGYGNEYATAGTPYFGQASEDIYYRFSVTGTTLVSISTCSSGFDTYIHLLNSDGSPREHN